MCVCALHSKKGGSRYETGRHQRVGASVRGIAPPPLQFDNTLTARGGRWGCGEGGKTQRHLSRHRSFLYNTYTSPVVVFIRRPIIPPTLPVSPLNVVRSALLLQIHVGGLTPNPTLNPQPLPKIIHLILCDPALPSPHQNLFKLSLVFFFFSSSGST